MIMLYRLELPEEGAKDCFKEIDEKGYEKISILDSNSLMYGLFDFEDIGPIMDHFMKKRGMTRDDAVKTIIGVSKDSRRIAGTIKYWALQESNVMPLITDFTVKELNHAAKKKGYVGSIGNYLNDVENMSSALCIYLKTPFFVDERRRSVMETLPEELRTMAAKKFTNVPDSNDNDMSLYSVAYKISESTDFKVSIVTIDKELGDFIWEANGKLDKKIYHFTLNKFIIESGLGQ